MSKFAALFAQNNFESALLKSFVENFILFMADTTSEEGSFEDAVQLSLSANFDTESGNSAFAQKHNVFPCEDGVFDSVTDSTEMAVVVHHSKATYPSNTSQNPSAVVPLSSSSTDAAVIAWDSALQADTAARNVLKRL